MGTVRCPFARECIRTRAARSASTSYATNSVPFHSSHSRISWVYWQLFVPYSSRIATADHLQGLADHVVNRGLYFLNTRNVIGTNDQRKISQASPLNFAAIVPEQRHRQKVAFPGFFERHDQITGPAAGGNCDGDIVRLSLRNHLTQKNNLGADIIGDRGDICRLKRERNCRNGLPSRGR